MGTARRLVMFDLDGTLLETNEVADRCFLAAFSETLGIRTVDTDWSSYRHVTDPGVAAEIIERHAGRPPRIDELEGVRRRYLELLEEALSHDPDQSRPVPGASKFLAELSSRDDLLTAVATGGWRESIPVKLRCAGLALDGIEMATGSDAVDRVGIMSLARKRAAARGDGTMGSCVYFGDGVWDVRAAAELDFGFVGIGRGRAAERLRAAGAARVLPDYEDLQAALAAIDAVA